MQRKINGKPLILGLGEPILTSQTIDFIGSEAKFRYSAEQRNFDSLSGELNG
jgi:hypothetical protein